MANETRGILYETIAEAALRQAIKLSNLSGVLRWNEKPTGMTIIPDFTIGLDKDNPTHVVLITASGAARNSDMKSWRNLGEMQEVKAQLPGPPIVLNIYFMSEMKLGLSAAANKLYDVIFHVDNQHYFDQLENWVKSNLKIVAKTKEEKRAILETAMKSNSYLGTAIELFSQDLSKMLKHRKNELDNLWALMQADYKKPHSSYTARNTAVRRGLAKLAVIEPSIRVSLYSNYKKISGIPLPGLPDYLFELGFFSKTISKASLVDRDILNVLELLGTQMCEKILNKAPGSMHIWINALRNLHRLAVHVKFISDHYEDVTNPSRLKQLIMDCYHDPAILSGEPSDEKVWVFEIMMSLIKANSGMLQGYGIADLARDTGIPEFGNSGLVLPPFIQRKKMLTEVQLNGLAKGLAVRFGENVSKLEVSQLKEKVIGFVIKENLEDRLIPYRMFEPLLILLEEELQQQSKVFNAKAAYVGWIGEYSEAGRQSATTVFVQVGNYLIHWKSSYSTHPNDKTKELSARARSIKFQYNSKTKTFTLRKGINNEEIKLALIVDGDWTDRHLQTLSDSGWDRIVYPDEIQKLVSEL